MIAVNKADGDSAAPRQGGGRRIPRGPAHPDAALRGLDAAGGDDLGPHRAGPRRAVAEGARPPRPADGDRANSPPSAARQDAKWMWALVHERMHERLTHDPALRQRVPADRTRRRRAARISPTAGRGRDRGPARALTVARGLAPRHRLRAVPAHAAQSERAPRRGGSRPRRAGASSGSLQTRWCCPPPTPRLRRSSMPALETERLRRDADDRRRQPRQAIRIERRAVDRASILCPDAAGRRPARLTMRQGFPDPFDRARSRPRFAPRCAAAGSPASSRRTPGAISATPPIFARSPPRSRSCSSTSRSRRRRRGPSRTGVGDASTLGTGSPPGSSTWRSASCGKGGRTASFGSARMSALDREAGLLLASGCRRRDLNRTHPTPSRARGSDAQNNAVAKHRSSVLAPGSRHYAPTLTARRSPAI